jgi:transketolase N-terminal domain/subunit
VFEEKNNLLEKGEVTVIVDLGPLFQRWQEAGAKGVNVKVIEESTQVQVLKMPAKFMGLPMNANESQTILIKVDALKPQPTRTTETTIEERISETAPSIPMLQSIVYTLDLASPVTEQFEFVVSNSEKAGNVVLVFEEKNNLLEKGEVSVIVDLGPLFQRWQEAGAKGVNVKVIEDSTQVQVLKMPANFMDLPMDANESQTILIKVDALKPQPIRTAESTIRYVEEERISESTPSTPKQPSDVEESTPSTPKQPSDVEESTPSTPKQPSDVEESTPSTPKQPSDVEESAPSTPKQPSDVEESTPSTQPSDVEESAPSTPKQPSDVEESAPSTPKQPSDVEESAPSTQPSDVEESAPSTQPSDVEESTTSTLRQHSIHYFMDFASQMTEPFEIVVSNPEEPANTDLVFEENNKHLNNGEVKVIVDLGPLFPRWQAAGAKGFNVGILDEGPQVQLLKTPAKFMGLPMNASESQTILIKVDALKPMPTRTVETTTYQVVEEEREPTPSTLRQHSIHYFLDFASQMTEPFEMVVSNSEEPANIDLVFEENNKRLNNGEVKVIVDLGPLFPRWQAAGAKGFNVGILDEGPQVQLLKTPAKFIGLPMNASESQTILIKVDALKSQPTRTAETTTYQVVEEEREFTPILPRHSIHYFLDIASQMTEPFEMVVSNSEEPANIDLVFEENNKRLNKGEVRIIVDLGPLFPRWQTAGAKGLNVGILDKGPQVQLLKTPAKIMGIKMTAAESQIIKVKTDTFNPMPGKGTDTDGDDIKDVKEEPIPDEGDDIKDEEEPESTTILPRHSIHYFLDFASQTTAPFEMTVSNSEGPANIDLVFEENNKRLDKGEVRIIVDLGPLFPRWQAAGAKGINVGILDEGPQVQLLKTPAKIMGIKMTAAESQIIKVKTDTFNPMPKEGTDTDGDDIKDEPIQEEGDDIKDVKEEPIPESTTTPSTRRHRIHYILDFAGNMTEPFEVAVSNSEKDANVDLVFEGKSNILDKGEVNVIVDLGPLFPRWQAAGAKGVNVGILDEGPQVQLLKTPAQFKGIPMSASESQTIQIRVDAIQGTSREDSFSETTRDSTPSDGIPFDGEPRECVRLCAPPGSYYSY